MSKRNGFTLVELMVVIVIIGVLAAVAIPKMMAATNKAKASEGPQILSAIANMQAAHKAEQDTFVVGMPATPTGNAATGAPADPSTWGKLGFDQNPSSRYFAFTVPGVSASAFTATATLGVNLGKALSGDNLTINEFDIRVVSSQPLRELVPNWR